MTNKDSSPEKNERTPQLISLKEAAELCGLTRRHLRLLASTEKIYAVRMGRDWFTTKDAIQAYLSTDRRPGPKPSK